MRCRLGGGEVGPCGAMGEGELEKRARARVDRDEAERPSELILSRRPNFAYFS